MTAIREPNFFILGAQKSGTSYLAAALARHPDVYFTNPKEPLFFQKQGLTRADYDEYLIDHFSDARDETWAGEGSTVYLQWPRALDHIRSFVPGTPKFIVCLRQPTEKAVSFYIHNWRRGRYPEGTTLQETLAMRDTLSVLFSSLYAPSIERWFDAYPPENFCFIDFATLQRDPAAFVETAADLLGIDTSAIRIPDSTINEGIPLAWEGDELIATRQPEAANGPARFTRDSIAELHERCLPDISATEALTGLDLSNWRALPAF